MMDGSQLKHAGLGVTPVELGLCSTLTGQGVGASVVTRRSYRQNLPDIYTKAHLNLSILLIRGAPRLRSPSGQLRDHDCQVGCHAPTSVAVTLWRSLHVQLHPE